MALLQGCQDLWDEHCIYTGYLEGHIEWADSTLQMEDFRLAYYPMDGLGMGVLDGQWDPYDATGVAGRSVNIGDYQVLSYCPGDFDIRDTASLGSITLVGHHAWDAGKGLELITTSTRPAASDLGRGTVDIDDTTKVWMQPELLTQHLRLTIRLIKVPDGSDFHPTECLLSGIASEKRLYDLHLTGDYLHILSPFKEEAQGVFRTDMIILGTAGAPDHLLRILCMAGGKEYSFPFDLSEELHTWQSPFREITLSLKVGETMETAEVQLLGWIDKDQGDFPLLNER